MNIDTVVEKYIELSVKRDSLKEAVENSKRHYEIAQASGDNAFNNQNYQSEKGYNNSMKSYAEKKEKEEENLKEVEELLGLTDQAYTQSIQTLSESQLKELAINLSLKKSKIEQKVLELSQRKNIATAQGDKWFSEHNYEQEQKYNNIVSECDIEIDKIKPQLHYYESFVKDLNYQASKKANQELKQNGQVMQ